MAECFDLVGSATGFFLPIDENYASTHMLRTPMYEQIKILHLIRSTQLPTQLIRLVRRTRNVDFLAIGPKKLPHVFPSMMNMRMMMYMRH